MSTPIFLEWLDFKFADQPRKVVPPNEVLADRLAADVRDALRKRITAEILLEAGFDRLIDEAMKKRAGILVERAQTIRAEVTRGIGDEPSSHWSAPVGRVAKEIADSMGDDRCEIRPGQIPTAAPCTTGRRS